MKVKTTGLKGEYNTCVQAFPGAQAMRDEDGDTIYRVSEFCPMARKSENLIFLRDKDLCEDCPNYANRSRYIHIRNGNFCARIYVDRLTAFPIKNLRRLFRIMIKAERENEADIAYLTDLLTNGPLYHAETESQLRHWGKVRDLWDEMRKKWGH